jgi:hypothetical protein
MGFEISVLPPPDNHARQLLTLAASSTLPPKKPILKHPSILLHQSYSQNNIIFTMAPMTEPLEIPPGSKAKASPGEK